DGHIDPADISIYACAATSRDALYLDDALPLCPGYNPGLYLYDPDGNATLGASHGSFAEFANWRLSKTGTYTLMVFDNALDEWFEYLRTRTVTGVKKRRRRPDSA